MYQRVKHIQILRSRFNRVTLFVTISHYTSKNINRNQLNFAPLAMLLCYSRRWYWNHIWNVCSQIWYSTGQIQTTLHCSCGINRLTPVCWSTYGILVLNGSWFTILISIVLILYMDKYSYLSQHFITWLYLCCLPSELVLWFLPRTTVFSYIYVGLTLFISHFHVSKRADTWFKLRWCQYASLRWCVQLQWLTDKSNSILHVFYEI